jgi:DivIVA domain-containing protein
VLHLLISAVAAVVIAGVLFLLATRFLPAGEQIAPAVRDEPPWELPAERRMTADDIDDLRLPVALRGYRFAETDLLLDRLADELRSRDEEIARLRGHEGDDSDNGEPAAADELVAPEPVAPDDDSR